MRKIIGKADDIFGNTILVIYEFGEFGISILEYIAHKIDGLISYFHRITISNIDFFVLLKFKTVGRLIWSRGRLSTQFRFLAVILLTISIFMVGGVFQSRFVESDSKYTTLFLATTESILTSQATASTQEGMSALLNTTNEHTVIEGETLASIAQNYSISIESIKFANKMVSNNVKIGQVLRIPPVEGTLHEVVKGDTIEKLSKRYNVPTQTIVDFNYLDEPYTLNAGEVITIPDAQQTTEKFYAGNNVYDTSAYGLIPYSGKIDPGSGNFIWPLSGLLTQGFSSYHPAIDIANRSGDIIASDKGVVVRAGWWQGGYGNAVQLDHGNGFVTTYAHMSSIAVSNGEEVDKGQKLGVVGSTGRSTGPHVHFTIQKDGGYLNPLSLLQR